MLDSKYFLYQGDCMKNFNPIRGTYDYLPKEARLREYVRTTILNSYQENGYNLIDTPILESLEFLDSSEGGDNLRLMFKTIKRGEKLDLTKENLCESDIVEEGLRYDLTVPLARMYSNNREKLPTPFRTIQIGSAFRAERPQKGRNRQFTQCDIDVFGDSSINAELELIKTCFDTLERLGFANLTLRINDREILNRLVRFAGFEDDELNTVCVTLDKIDKISITGVMMELIEKGFATEKINKLVDIVNDIEKNGLQASENYGVSAEKISNLNYLIDSLNHLTKNRYTIKYDISIVRGQGYYTGTVYEMYTGGFSGAIGGGGRYDKMVEKFSGIACPAVGICLGFEPICMLLKDRQNQLDIRKNLILIYDNDDDIIEVFRLKDKLKKEYNVALYLRPKNSKNFYTKIGEVADMVTSVKEQKENKSFKIL